LLVGSGYSDAVAENSGAAYVYRFDGSIWAEEAKLTAADAAAYDAFGNAVSLSGDVAVIGAPYDDDLGANSGSAYVFRRSGNSWSQEQKLTSSEATAGDYFGYSVAVSGDTIVVGAVHEAIAGTEAGAAYAFGYDVSQWKSEAVLRAPDADPHDLFGHTVAVDGDRAVIGAYGYDLTGESSGGAFVAPDRRIVGRRLRGSADRRRLADP
jgi:hypothetical protein